MYFIPYIYAISPLVRGTVANQSDPMQIEKTTTVVGVIGVIIKIAAIIVRPK